MARRTRAPTGLPVRSSRYPRAREARADRLVRRRRKSWLRSCFGNWLRKARRSRHPVVALRQFWIPISGGGIPRSPLRAFRPAQISRLRRLWSPSQRKGEDATGALCRSLRTTHKAMGGKAGSYPQRTRENAQSVGERRLKVEGRKIVGRKKGPRGIAPRGCFAESTIRFTYRISMDASL